MGPAAHKNKLNSLTKGAVIIDSLGRGGGGRRRGRVLCDDKFYLISP